MRSLYFDLGTVHRDAIVTVSLEAQANVRLMTKTNFEAYRKRQFYRMLGGVAVSHRFMVTIPANGHWFLVVDVEGLNSLLPHAQVSVTPEKQVTGLPLSGDAPNREPRHPFR